MEPPTHSSGSAFRLRIGPVIQSADALVATIRAELPGHPGLARAATAVASAAKEAERISKQLQRPLGVHRLPAIFLVTILLVVAGWIYFHFFHVSNLTLAISQVDAVQLKRHARHRVRLSTVETLGSRESLDLLAKKKADLAFVQGGITIPDAYPRTRLPSSEVVLYLVRQGRTEIRNVLTSAQQQGSHTLAQTFMALWERDVNYVHGWRELAQDSEAVPADNIDAVFVVKDPANDNVAQTLRRLMDHGFVPATAYLGAKSKRVPCLSEAEVSLRYLDPRPDRPDHPLATYHVATYLVARDGLTPRQLAVATSLLNSDMELAQSGVEPTFEAASEILQGVEAILGVIVYIGLAVLAMLGLDIVAYRRRFHELNSLVSMISMHQGEKDVIFGDAKTRAHNIRYLGACSDLLGLISVICGYYAQENSSLMYNRLFEVIHDRCDGLKINIQLKILHSTVLLDENGVPASREAR